MCVQHLALKCNPSTVHIRRRFEKIRRGEFFFREKKFRPKKIFREKKLKKMCFAPGALQIFWIASKIRVQERFWRSFFVTKIDKNADSLRCFAPPKIAAWATFVCSFFVDKMCCKNREKTSPRLALLNCEWTLSNPLRYFAPFAV